MLTALAFSAFSLDHTLAQLVATYGAWALGIVGLVIFCETGLVFMPFLPGDSLLFLSGTVLTQTTVNVHVVVAVLIVAAVLGDTVNFWLGRRAAPRILRQAGGRWLKRSHVDATQAYFERFGALTVVIARFIPIVRTMAPFLAGAGGMSYGKFAAFNVAGGALWVAGLVYLGAFFGAQPVVRDNLTAASALIVVISLIPVAVAAIRAIRRRPARARPALTHRAPATGPSERD